jgi:hypothetical protein
MLIRLAFAPHAQHSYLRKLRPPLSTSRILLLTADSNGYHKERMLHHPISSCIFIEKQAIFINSLFMEINCFLVRTHKFDISQFIHSEERTQLFE